jgi:hypothetical protein
LLILDNSLDPDNADVHFLMKNAAPEAGVRRHAIVPTRTGGREQW